MHGLRERNTHRWQIHRALLEAEIARMERELAALAPGFAGRDELVSHLEAVRARLRVLGPSPQSKMG